eukprot:154887-Prymnesium_polylepis.2
MCESPNECLGRLGILSCKPADGAATHADLRQENLAGVSAPHARASSRAAHAAHQRGEERLRVREARHVARAAA